ncbi:F-box protein At5g07610-like [Papaver somniferum]|uniref:F-box protein At5g07610-like n=1 Tax=Papaver somniferum TaxID=3469 RepID=UPI000E6F8536|nr:F-box protein At5g07610-like [Papaver somniferum]
MDSSSSNTTTDQTYLTEDFLYEIFLHLDIDSIFKFKCVSKVWLSILSNPNFINRWYKVNTSLWALVHASATEGNLKNLKVTLSHPESNSQFICHHQTGFSFGFLDQKHDLSNTKLTDGLLIIGSSNGLVLCATSYFNQKTYYVCNPLTKKSVLLPPPPKEQMIVQTGFTCDECCFSSSLGYKVIRLPVFHCATTFNVEIFSSDLGEWNVHDVLCPPDVTWSSPRYDNLVSHNGTSYWMQKTSNKILAFSAHVNKHNNHGTYGIDSKLIELPELPMDDENRYLSQCLGESEGFICYAIVRYTQRSLSVWVLDEDWYLLHKDIKFCDVLAQMKPSLIGVESSDDLISDIQVLGFNPVDKNVVILHYDKYLCAYNMKTRGYQKLFHPSFLGGNLSVPGRGFSTFILGKIIYMPLV